MSDIKKIKDEYLDKLNGDLNLENVNQIKIELFGSAEIIDLTNKVQGDTLIINYQDSLINDIKIISNAKFFNYAKAKFNQNSKYQDIEDRMSSKKCF